MWLEAESVVNLYARKEAWRALRVAASSVPVIVRAMSISIRLKPRVRRGVKVLKACPPGR
jgi:hypothetical protein